MYVSYEFYSQTYGTTIPEADFPKAEAKAEAVIGYLTYINGDIFAKEDNRVKLAVLSALRRRWSTTTTPKPVPTATRLQE